MDLWVCGFQVCRFEVSGFCVYVVKIEVLSYVWLKLSIKVGMVLGFDGLGIRDLWVWGF